MNTKPAVLTSLRILITTALVAGTPLATRAESASPSELLEKGIYAEETKGDLDGAIAIYQQLVAEANANRSLAAQAQFRLGECLVKKNHNVEATAAFQKLIHDYPNEKELIAQARVYLPKQLEFGPVPWVDGERMQLNITLASGADIGVCEYRADYVQQANGHTVWRVGCRLMAVVQSVSSVDVDPDTFHPLSAHWKHSLLGEVNTVYGRDEVVVSRVETGSVLTNSCEGQVLDNEEAMHAIRRLPLKVGYKTTLPIFSTLGSSTMISIPLEVKGKETVQVPAGKFDCVKVHLGLVNQDFWFSDDAHRYLVKFEAGGIDAELTAVTEHKSGQPIQFHDADTGVSFTTPADWVVWRARKGQPSGQVLIRTLDPEADTADGGVRLFLTSSLSDAAQKSARAWIDEDLLKNTQLKVRPDSWKDVTVDGRPGVSYVADYAENGKPLVQYLFRVLGQKYSELLVITSPPDKFDALKTQFDTIVASYRTK